jgi:hypothetical protein
MDPIKNSLAVLISVAISMFEVPLAEAQFGPLVTPEQAPQAQSERELDAYLDIIQNKTPGDVVRKVDAFALTFPKSELVGLAYQHQLNAFERLNDFEGMLRAGAKSLQGNPDNLNTLLALAPAMASRAAHRADCTQLLSRAETYANQVLETVEKTRLPH